jgi:hypothetical protein
MILEASRAWTVHETNPGMTIRPPDAYLMVTTNRTSQLSQITYRGAIALAGDAVWFPANVSHWHGAKADTTMTHIAIQEKADDGQDTRWEDEVSNRDYPA